MKTLPLILLLSCLVGCVNAQDTDFDTTGSRMNIDTFTCKYKTGLFWKMGYMIHVDKRSSMEDIKSGNGWVWIDYTVTDLKYNPVLGVRKIK